MKTLSPFIFFAVILNFSSFSQSPQRGIYLSFADYEKGNLSYTSACGEKNTIRLRETSLFSTFVIKYKDRKIRLYKDSVYAVAECGQPLVRFQNKECFYLAEKGGVWVFYTEARTREEKTTVVVRNYFFCVNGSDRLRPLTVSNLKAAFPANDQLQDILDAEFKTEDASAFDTFHHQFKINHILKDSQH
ncbi:MAG: hypothetical protein ACXVPQ_04910 [Bacteroidia bacterium]